MNILILAAGYATRLYPLTKNQAKPLLPVAGKPMIEWVLDNLAPIPDIEKVCVVTNDKFAGDFQNWANDYEKKAPGMNFRIINDGSRSDADKLGAIGDMHFSLHQANLWESDLLVVAGDNLFSQPVDQFAKFAKDHPATLALYDVGDLKEAAKFNKVTTDEEGVVTDFVEKPENPDSTLCGIALYYYRKDTLPLINDYVAEGNNTDQPGRLIQWLHQRVRVGTWTVPGIWFDIGSKESLEEANRIFRNLPR